MSTFLESLSRAYDFFLSPNKESRSTAESREQRSLSPTRMGKSDQSGNDRSKKTKKAIRQDRTKSIKINKHVVKSTSSTKARVNASERTWNIPGILKFYERSQMSSNGETLEGETLMDDGLSISCEAENAGAATIVVEEDFPEPDQRTNNANISFQDRTLQRDDPRIEDWSEDEIWVFNKLVMRGQEPLLPYELASEFASWPDILFSKDQTQFVISNISRSTTNRTNMIPSPMCQANA